MHSSTPSYVLYRQLPRDVLLWGMQNKRYDALTNLYIIDYLLQARRRNPNTGFLSHFGFDHKHFVGYICICWQKHRWYARSQIKAPSLLRFLWHYMFDQLYRLLSAYKSYLCRTAQTQFTITHWVRKSIYLASYTRPQSYYSTDYIPNSWPSLTYRVSLLPILLHLRAILLNKLVQSLVHT